MSALSYLEVEILSSYKRLKLHKISPSGCHAFRSRRLKSLRIVRGYNWTTQSPAGHKYGGPIQQSVFSGVRLTPSPCNASLIKEHQELRNTSLGSSRL